MILLFVVLLLIASYTAAVSSWWQQRSEIRSLESSNAQARANIAELQDETLRWEDPAYVTQQARERLGWVMPGEVGYRVIGVDGEVQGGSAELDAPPTTAEAPWFEKLWVTVDQADQELVGETEGSAESNPEETGDTEPGDIEPGDIVLESQ